MLTFARTPSLALESSNAFASSACSSASGTATNRGAADRSTNLPDGCSALFEITRKSILSSKTGAPNIAPFQPLPLDIWPLDRFEHEIRAFEKCDAANPPAPGGTLFVGSSTLTKWTELEQVFRQFRAINRGFGGSTLPEIDHYFFRIVTPYKPSRIVLYAGTNDIGDGHPAQRVYRDFLKFEEDVKTALPNAELYFISMSMPPCRVKFAQQYAEGNTLIQGHCSQSPHLHYIDVTPVMHDSDGKLKKSLFGKDRLHMTKAGYDAWTPIIEAALREPLTQQ